jgi:thiol:disulfide interchange protein
MLNISLNKFKKSDMKSILIIVAIALVVLVSAMTHSPNGDTDAGTGINFETGSWNQALELAKKENKLVFLDIYASWCGPCKMLKSRTFPDAKVGAFYNENFINYAVDAEKGEGVNLASKYNITGYPTLLFVDGKGNLVAKTMGYHNPEEFLEVGQKIVKQHQ